MSADDEVLLCHAHGHDPKGYHVHLWMENTNIIDLGNWFLKVLLLMDTLLVLYVSMSLVKKF